LNKKNDKQEENNECFIVMPISNVEGYPNGHFKEVYEDLIKPAVVEAGYEPIRADDVSSSNLIQLDVVSKVINAKMCICDLSTKNPNVLFEYGIRQAFDKPTVLIKDDITDRIFDLSGFRDIEYDHTLRAGNVQKSQKQIKKSINSTIQAHEEGGDVFSLVKLLTLTQAATLPDQKIDPDSAQFNLLYQKIESLADLVRRQGASLPLSKNQFDKGIERRKFVGKDFIVNFDEKTHSASINYKGQTFIVEVFGEIPKILIENLPHDVISHIREFTELF
jgi:hypothetical protein